MCPEISTNRPTKQLNNRFPSSSLPRRPHHNTRGEQCLERLGAPLTDRTLDVVATFPVLVEARDRALGTLAQQDATTADLTDAIESDVALTITTLRAIHRPVATITEAVEIVDRQKLKQQFMKLATFDFFERNAATIWGNLPERFHLHAVATQHAAMRVLRELGAMSDRDRVMVAALLHDVGKLALGSTAKRQPSAQSAEHAGSAPRSFADRIEREKLLYGFDHTVAGAALIRAWGLSLELADTVECHHHEQVTGDAAVIQLADLIAHYEHGVVIQPELLREPAKMLGIDLLALRRIVYDLADTIPAEAHHHPDPCPLSPRELDVLQQLSKGKVYKQIALELGLSASTVRSHLHNVYAKLGAVDRAQAVLVASSHGWL